jgi:hypothetical protein
MPASTSRDSSGSGARPAIASASPNRSSARFVASVQDPYARLVMTPCSLAELGESPMKVGVQLEERHRDGRREKHGDTWKEPHARERQPDLGRRPGEPPELGLGTAVIEALPDAAADVRAHAQPGHISDPRVVQLLPRPTNDGGGGGVERELERVRHRPGS